jgi:glycosyltransferase involved in cell wall biosynthesis
MRLTWLANAPWTNYGYGVQTGLFGTRLTTAGHPVGVISNFGHQGAPINWLNLQVFGNSFHPYCMDIMHMHSQTFQADAMLTLLDLQVMEPEALQGTKWIAWFPVDHVTIPSFILEKVKQADFRITMSQHASQEMDKTGLDYYYIPCGVDTKIYKPLPMFESREAMQFPTDKFIVGMVAMNKGNPSRKAFHQNIMAFAALQKKRKDCVLYLHTADGTRGPDMVNLVEYCKALGLKHGYAFHDDTKGADVIFADQYGLTMGYDPAMMAQLYSAMDVHLLVTCGEGFGIPLIEAQACGTPVITGNWTSMPELCFSGWKVPVEGTEPYFTPLMAFQMLPRISAISEKLDAAYLMRGNQDYRKRAEKGAQAYDADRIVEKYWLPTLADIESKLQSIPVGTLARNLDILRVAV